MINTRVQKSIKVLRVHTNHRIRATERNVLEHPPLQRFIRQIHLRLVVVRELVHEVRRQLLFLRNVEHNVLLRLQPFEFEVFGS